MKTLILLIPFIFFPILQVKLKSLIDSKIREKIKKILIKKYGENQKFRIDRGVEQVAQLWNQKDGTVNDFEEFCKNYFIGTPELVDVNFKRLETNIEVINGNFNKMMLDLKRALHLDWGKILPIDILFGQFNPSAHLIEDLFQNKIAFFIRLNFPYYTLEEKEKYGSKWDRKQWAYARMGDMFISRVPANIYQKISKIMTSAETYISEYNIFMGKLIDEKHRTYFPKNLKLISHWGLRDELKARYADPDGFYKQKMIYKVMLRIIEQDIPQIIINNPEYYWNPFENKVYKNGKEISFKPELFTRYKHFLNTYKAMKELDPYYPSLPTHIKRKFEMEREIPEKEVTALFTEFLSSPQIKKVANLISKRLKRKLEPFDIWYPGFKVESSIPEKELDRIVKRKYPDINHFRMDLKNILIKIGFSNEQANSIAPKIEVDPARGAGHAWGAEMKSDKSRLRTRIPKEGMDYKGFNIAMHELGHCVEQTLTLQKIDYYMLHGVPNTAFTEAFAFLFQEKDLEVLGVKKEDLEKEYLRVLDTFWKTYEIIGVSLVDINAWNWLYKNPNASPEELKKAVISIAKDIWNKYYADIFGIKDQPILAIYSHMIDSALYLPDYPLGHIIAFQIKDYLKDKNLGEEMERMCKAGSIIPKLWMRNAVGDSISIVPLLNAVNQALKCMK